MRVGITFDLRADYLAAGYGEEETAEFDRPDTIEAIEGAIRTLGHETERIGNLQALVCRLGQGHRWDLVFNIAEGLHGYAREAVIPALLEAYAIPCTFSDPLIMSLTLHKALAKRVIRDHGILTPEFAVAANGAELGRIDLPFPLFAKPVSEGTGKGVTTASKVETQYQLIAVGLELIKKFRQPVLIETFLPGREFTVGVLGSGDEARVMGAMEIILLANSDPEVYSYRNKEICEEVVEYRLVDDPTAQAAKETALAAHRALNCLDASRIDLRCDGAGQPQFIEVNPLAGLHPEHSDLCILATKVGMPYLELIRTIVDSAIARIPPHA
jgi:D-alanine-D-alanine ligase